MKTHTLTQTDLVVSRLAYGAGMLELNWTDADLVEKAASAMRAAHENGITFFDLADVYCHGRSEIALGEVLKTSPGLRNQLVIQTKCNMVLSPKWRPDDMDHDESVNSRRDYLVSAAEASLRRLGTDRLDILVLHVPDRLMRPQEVAQAFDDLHESGKVRYFGISNHTQAQIELLKKHLRQPLAVHQIRLGLGYYAAVADMIDYCQLHGIQVEAHSPLRGGPDWRASLLQPPADASDAFKNVTRTLADIAREKGVNPSAIALAWLLHHPAGIIPIVGTCNPHYLAENCAADNVVLTDLEWNRLTRLAAGM